jgi:hypothetical protein
MASNLSSAKSMRFPCGHSEPERSAAGRVHARNDRALWIACPRCNVIALVCAPARTPARQARKSLTSRTS